jgi:hypothetical protein
MIEDRYRPLVRRVVTQVPDGGGGFTETITDIPILGHIGEMSGREVRNNKQIGSNASATLWTDAAVTIEDRIVDGVTEYEVVWKYKQFPRYDLAQVK